MATAAPEPSVAFAPRPDDAAPTRRAGIIAVGRHLPSQTLTNAELETIVETSDTWIMERTGIRQRHRVGSGETAATLGAEAARKVLAKAETPRIDALICATCSPDTLFPSTACLIQRALGLADIPAFDINAACSGFIYGLTVARALVASGQARTVLLITAEAMTSLVDFTDRSTCVLFGDGAAATLVGALPSGGIEATWWGADGNGADLIYFGPSDGSEADRLRMAGRGTFRLAVDRLCEATLQTCAGAGWSVGDIDHFVPHQANLRIIEAVAKRLGLPPDRLVLNVESVGNTSAASIPLALAQADEDGRLAPGDRIACVAFGAGTTWGGAALQWTVAPSR